MDILETTLETSEDAIHLKTEELDDQKIVSGSNLTIIEEDGSISDDQGVDNLAHAQAILDADDEVQYQLRSNEGVTYRVVHVNQDDGDTDGVNSVVSPSYTQNQQGATVLATSGLNANHFYVIGTNEVFNAQSPRSLAPRTSMTIENRNIVLPTNSNRGRRDDRRRATHNEVERRRRDKINNWIAKLSKIIPDCNSVENAKGVQSKGGILARACEYILELRNANQRLEEYTKENEHLVSHLEFLQKQNNKLKIDNALMKSLLSQNGLTVPSDLLVRDADS